MYGYEHGNWMFGGGLGMLLIWLILPLQPPGKLSLHRGFRIFYHQVSKVLC